jgi:hypothetical protein
VERLQNRREVFQVLGILPRRVCVTGPSDVVLKNSTTVRAGSNSGRPDRERWFIVDDAASLPEPRSLSLEQRLATADYAFVVSALYTGVIIFFPAAMRAVGKAPSAWIRAFVNYIAINKFRDLAKNLLLRRLLLLWRRIVRQRCPLITHGHRRVDRENIIRVLKGLLKRLLHEPEKVLYVYPRRAGGRRADNLGNYHLLNSEADRVVKVNGSCIRTRKVQKSVALGAMKRAVCHAALEILFTSCFRRDCLME